MSKPYDVISVIYNPKSTGDAPAIAKKLIAELQAAKVADTVSGLLTKHAGHAETLALAAANATKRPLIISVSGDGGYHEVVNGVLASKNKRAVCTVEGAGNANDHWRIVHDGTSLVERIAKKPKTISLLKLKTTSSGGTSTRYAHSYIGFGLSAQIAVELNKNDLNAFNEKKILYDTVVAGKTFRLRTGSSKHRLDSLIAGNINEMAKQLKLAPKLDLTSQRLTLIMHHHHGPWRLIARLLGASLKADTALRKVSDFQATLLTDA